MPLLIDKTLPAYEDDVRRVELRRPGVLATDRFEKETPVLQRALSLALGSDDEDADAVIPTSELVTLIEHLADHIERIEVKASGAETYAREEIRDYLDSQGPIFLIQKLYGHWLMQCFIRNHDIDLGEIERLARTASAEEE